MPFLLLPAQATEISREGGIEKTAHPSPAHTLPYHPHATASTPQLKFSTDPLDESRIGKISNEERTLLLAHQQLLATDKPASDIVALQNQIRQLQNDNDGLRTQLAQIHVPPAIEPSSTVIASPSTAAITNQAAAEQPSTNQTATIHGTATEPANWQNWLWQMGWLGITIPVALWGMRRYTRRSQLIKAAESMPPPQLKVGSLRTSSATPSPYQSAGNVSGIYPAHQAIGTQTSRIPVLQPAKNMDEEAAAIIEEANLYAIHNHPLRGVKLLQELLADQPKRADAWLLLFAILSSLEQTEAFEKNARNFLRYNGDEQPTWKMIQMLGRTLDASHDLYRKSNLDMTDTAPENHQLIGEVLVELDMILPETLRHCLEKYDSKQHGRLGAYLVSQKIILHTQLTQALAYQQESDDATSLPDVLPADDHIQYKMIYNLNRRTAAQPDALPFQTRIERIAHCVSE